MPAASDRTVHAIVPGGEIVRYDRAGKWYLEFTDGRARKPLSLRAAAELAGAHDAQALLGRPGGLRFDAKVRAAQRA